jgi:hypothetical protein
MKLKLKFDKTEAATVYGLYRTQHSFKITIPDGSSLVFDGYVKEIGLVTPIDNLVMQDVSIKTSGAFTYAPAA